MQLAAVDYVGAGQRLGETFAKGARASIAGAQKSFKEWANIRDNNKYVRDRLAAWEEEYGPEDTAEIRKQFDPDKTKITDKKLEEFSEIAAQVEEMGSAMADRKDKLDSMGYPGMKYGKNLFKKGFNVKDRIKYLDEDSAEWETAGNKKFINNAIALAQEEWEKKNPGKEMSDLDLRAALADISKTPGVADILSIPGAEKAIKAATESKDVIAKRKAASERQKETERHNKAMEQTKTDQGQQADPESIMNWMTKQIDSVEKTIFDGKIDEADGKRKISIIKKTADYWRQGMNPLDARKKAEEEFPAPTKVGRSEILPPEVEPEKTLVQEDPDAAVPVGSVGPGSPGKEPAAAEPAPAMDEESAANEIRELVKANPKMRARYNQLRAKYNDLPSLLKALKGSGAQ